MIERLLQAERAMALGLIDQAEAIYRQLAESDSRNAVAVVGLARVALERRQDRLAYDLSVRALEIDPQDEAALRMEARLSEVLTTRGEQVERPAFVLPSGTRGTTAANAPGPVLPASDAVPSAAPRPREAVPATPRRPGDAAPTAATQPAPPGGDAPAPGPAERPRRDDLFRRLGLRR